MPPHSMRECRSWLVGSPISVTALVLFARNAQTRSNVYTVGNQDSRQYHAKSHAKYFLYIVSIDHFNQLISQSGSDCQQRSAKPSILMKNRSDVENSIFPLLLVLPLRSVSSVYENSLDCCNLGLQPTSEWKALLGGSHFTYQVSANWGFYSRMREKRCQ